MIDSKILLADLQSKTGSRTTMVKRLEDDLRARCDADPAVDAPLQAQYDAARKQKRTALTYKAWREEQLTQIAVAWVLGCVFVRFLEDNGLVETPKLSGPGARLQRARDEHEVFFRSLPQDNTDRGYLIEIFEETGSLPGMREFFDKKHNPLWLAAPSGDACRELLQFWQKTDPETGALLHDFTDPEWNTRFLGDLYQDLSEAARKKYALLQTPDFIESFILDRTLTPAIETFGYRVVRLIDPTCGSGHFLLGTFARLFRIWQDECPGENPRVLAQRALDGVYGVDLNPFAVAIARFRLLLAALQVSGSGPGGRLRLKDAPDFTIHLATGDALLHGRRFRQLEGETRRQSLFDTDEEVFRDELKHHYEVEDTDALHRILGQQYHAVVGNPPYITVKDRALSELYRQRYDSCAGKYALSVPFMDRFFDLAVTGSADLNQPAGFQGQITSNSFMKREFGKKLIEEFIPKWHLTHVIDTSGAYIPGHGTPTVILFGRNVLPKVATVRTVMGIKGEPATPEDPSTGLVWSAIIDQVDRPGSESDYVSAADTEREKFHSHPWNIGGGGASALKEEIEEGAEMRLGKIVDQLRGKPNIGITSFTLEDDLFIQPQAALKRAGLAPECMREMVEGDTIRDWSMDQNDFSIWPYDSDFAPVLIDLNEPLLRFMWQGRTCISKNKMFGGKTKVETGLNWYEFGRLTSHKLKTPLSITFAAVVTHNQFVLDRGGRVFKQSAPVIKLPASAAEADHLIVLGLLNSSTACFWIKQVFYPKATTTGDISVEKGRPEANRYDVAGTGLQNFPIPDITKSDSDTLLAVTGELDKLASDLASFSGDALTAKWQDQGGSLAQIIADGEHATARIKRRMIYLQEELDWLVYKLYGLIDQVFPVDAHATINKVDRPYLWTGSLPPESLAHELVDNYTVRKKLIRELPNLSLIETPVFKRPWLGRQGVYGSASRTYPEQAKDAVGAWLLARLEGYFHEGSRVCDLAGTFDPASHGFTAAARPHLVSANQLADIVQSDARFLEAAEVYEGAAGFSVPKLIRSLVESESVPALPRDRYKDSGLRIRKEWEETWRLQRLEDAVEEEVRSQGSGVNEEELKKRIRKAQLEKVGEIPVPPKYASSDFKKASHWKLRGKLDVPKERWICYPGAERAGDDSPLIAWAGWDHLQQAQALAEYFIDARDNQVFTHGRLKSLLAALADLVPWLKQWHNAYDPAYGSGLGDYFAQFLEEQCRALGMTVQEVDAERFTPSAEPPKARARKQAKKRSKATGAEPDASETDAAGHWQDQEFRLLAPKRKALTDYRMLVWPELLRQMPGEMEFETFRKAYWLLSEPEQLAKLGRETFADIPAAWWRSRTEQLAKEEFLPTLKGSVKLGDLRIWKQDGVRMVQWRGDVESGDFPETVDDARIALQLASLWIEEETDAVQATLEPELVLLETR